MTTALRRRLFFISPPALFVGFLYSYKRLHGLLFINCALRAAGNDAFVKKLTLFLATGRSNAFSDLQSLISELQSHLFSHVSPDCRTQNIHDDIRELRSPRRQIDLKQLDGKV